MAIEPEDSWTDSPLACVRLDCRAAPGAALPAHKDYLGSLMGLALRREALGDIVLPTQMPGTAFVFALEPAARLICEELCGVGRTEVSCAALPLEQLPDFGQSERVLRTAGCFFFAAAGCGACGHAALQPRGCGGTDPGGTGGDQPSAHRKHPRPRL